MQHQIKPGEALMDTNKMREQFEDVASRHYLLFERSLQRDEHQLDEYLDTEVQVAWEFWQASREAVVVELPAMLPEEEDQVGEDWPVNEAYNSGIKGAMVAIKAQGLKVSP